jgi:lipopolysaccharide/colanic/teichoic acid biosynthesis glycosyltransferase
MRVRKRLFDITAAAGILIAGAALLEVIAATIKLHDRGPMFYRAKRVGVGGREFGMWKFRSMVVDADIRFADVREQFGLPDHAGFQSR